MELKETFQKVKAASKTLGLLSDEQRNEILQAVADAIIAETPALLQANAEDLAKMDKAKTTQTMLENQSTDITDALKDIDKLINDLNIIIKHLQRLQSGCRGCGG